MRREGEAAMRCLPKEVAVAGAVLASVDGAVVGVAFVQLFRIHLRNQHLGWTRQKIFHLMIGSSNIGYLAYFISALIATCEGWRCWSHGCGFALMASPQIILLATFLLLISFWVDLCHQASDDEEEDYEPGCTEALLDKSMNKQDQLHADGCRVFCFPRTIHVGSRQKFVILVYLYTSSVAMLLLGALLFSKMSKVCSEMASTEMWKVASLAAITVLCFTSSAVLALATTVPLEMLSHWHPQDSEILINSVFVFLYYFIGSSVPSGFVLWVMREMPPSHVNYTHRTPQSTVVTFIRGRDSTANIVAE